MSKSGSKFRSAKRLIDLLGDLEAGKELTIQGVMDKCRVKKNAASEYIDFLGEIRALDSRILGGKKRWRLATRATGSAEQTSERALVHVAALEFAVDALDWLDGTPYFDQLRELRADVAASVPARDRDHVRRFVESVRRAPSGTSTNPTAFASAARCVLASIRGHHPCTMAYCRLDGDVRRYRVEPIALVLHQDRVFVMARKLPAREPRLFDLDGISDIECLTGETFVPPAVRDDPTNLLRDSFGVYVDEAGPCNVRLSARGPALAALRRRRFHATQVLGPQQPDGSAEVAFRVSPSPPLAQFVLGWMPHLRVLEPESLRDELQRAARAFLEDPSSGSKDPSSG